MVEMTIVISILALVMSAIMFGDRLQIFKGNDARRKDDLNKLKIAFENYYSDHNYYPYPAQTGFLDHCDSATDNLLEPYLKHIPCDPTTKLPYRVWTQDDSSTPQMFVIYILLQGDQTQRSAPCLATTPTLCLLSGTYNYYVSSPNIAEDGTIPQFFYCSNIGNCTRLLPPLTCPVNKTFPTATCNNCQNHSDICTPI